MSNYYDGESDNAAPVIAGDSADDDAAYIDALVNPAPALTPQELPLHEDNGPNVSIVVPNRMIARTGEFVGPMTRPTLLLPPDVNRKKIIFGSSAATYFAGDSQFLPAPAGVAFFEPSYGMAATNIFSDNIVIENYTGAFWIISAPSVGAATRWQYSLIAITE